MCRGDRIRRFGSGEVFTCGSGEVFQCGSVRSVTLRGLVVLVVVMCGNGDVFTYGSGVVFECGSWVVLAKCGSG